MGILEVDRYVNPGGVYCENKLLSKQYCVEKEFEQMAEVGQAQRPHTQVYFCRSEHRAGGFGMGCMFF